MSLFFICLFLLFERVDLEPSKENKKSGWLLRFETYHCDFQSTK